VGNHAQFERAGVMPVSVLNFDTVDSVG